MTRNASARSGLLFGAIALAAIVVLTLLLAPGGSGQQYGSTYSRAPGGYGGWYAFMQDRPTPLERWRKPLADLVEAERDAPTQVLLQVYSRWQSPNLSADEAAWLEAGQTLVILGARGPVTAADFRNQLPSQQGPVTVETRRRQPQAKEILLGDRFGAAVWEPARDRGRLILAGTPFLAANAYQDSPGNYEFLARLVSQQPDGTPVARIWVDEYRHGYRDREERQEEGKDSFWGYLVQTPLWPALVQALAIVAIALWALNRRFGRPAVLPEPAVNNSQAYIEALAGVLQKAASSDFVLATLSKAEQEQLQQELGLGRGPVEPQQLLAAWQQQTGRSRDELRRLLREPRSRRLSESELLTWLRRWQTLRWRR